MDRRMLAALLLVGVAGCFTPMQRAETSAAPPLTPAPGAPIGVRTVAALDPEAVLLLDVRTPREYAKNHVPRALNVPIRELPMRIEEVRIVAAGRPIVVYCEAGRRADSAVEVLANAGVLNTRRLSGDFPAWLAAGLRTEQEPYSRPNDWRNWN